MAGAKRGFPDESGAKRPDETLVDFKKRIQSAVDAGTYVAPARSEFGAGIANTAIDLARRTAEGVIKTPILTPVMAPPAVATPLAGEAVTQPKTSIVTPAASGTTPLQPSPTPFYKQPGWGISGQEGKIPLGEQPTAVRTNIEHGRTTLQAYGIPELTKSPEQIATERSIIRGGVGEPSATPIMPETIGGVTPQGTTPTGKVPWYYGGQPDPNDAALRKLDDMIERASNPRSRAGGNYLTGLLGARNTMASGISATADRERNFTNLSADKQAQMGIDSEKNRSASADRRLATQLGVLGRQDAIAERSTANQARIEEMKRYNDIRAEDVDLKRRQEANIKTETQSLKNSDSFFKHLEIVSPDRGIDETGKPIKARDIGVLDMMDSGQKFRDKVPDFYPAAQQLWDRREKEVVDAFAAGKKKYVAGDINKTGSETYKLRQQALKRIRDRMLGVIQEK